jgi:hypothetical protein
VEKTICADLALGSLDRELAEVFQQSIANAGNDAFVVRADQRRWLGEMNQQCDIRDANACIRQAFDMRISELKSQSVTAGITVFRLAKISLSYDFVVRVLGHTPEGMEGYLEGPAEILVSRKGATTPLQTITMENVFFSLGKDGKPITNTAPLYGDQGLINVGDFNFDGQEDFAVQDGHEGSYGQPSYSVFLYSPEKRRFSLNHPLSELTHEGLGFFGVDITKKRLIVLSKSGCCYHESTEYKVERDVPIPDSRVIEDATTNEKDVVVSHERYVDGKWQGTKEAGPVERPALKSFLQSYLGKPQFKEDEEDDQYLVAWVDLNDDGKQEAIVYVSGRSWCGSGGCITLVLAPQRTSYRLVTKITITRLPIRVMPEKSHGWHDISVTVQGGGILKAYEARLRFNGTTYASNPTVAPAQPVRGMTSGQVILSATDTNYQSVNR